jgi:hypothetical protein
MLLVGAGWSLGRAQARVADFYVTVDAPPGELKVECSRGCNWPRDTASQQVMTLQCETRPCRLIFNGHGRVMVGIPIAGER